MYKLKVTGIDLLEKQLGQFAKQVEEEVQAALEQSGEEMAAMARALAPVDDGDLRDSIKMTTAGGLTPLHSSGGQQEVGRLSVRVTAGNSSVRYASIVEFGRKGARAMAARPFFWPSYRSLKRKFRGRTTRAINKAIKRIAR